MKRNEIEKIINNHFKKIEKYFHKIVIGFEIEDIHEFRTEIKKLRAFLHLLEMESDDDIPFRITKKMKTFYGYAGVIRNLQLQVKSVEAYFENSAGTIPILYLNTLRNEIETWEKNTKDFMDPDNNFYNDEEKIKVLLPDKLKNNSVKKFIQYILYQLQKSLTRLEDDETLHSIRKYLKDIVYNWPFIQEDIGLLPVGLSNEEDVRSCTEILGHFRDKCIALVLLQTYFNDSLKNEEKNILQQMERDWLREKNELRQKFYARLEKLQLTSDKFNEITSIDTSYE